MENRRMRTFVHVGLVVLTMEMVVEGLDTTMNDDNQLDITSYYPANTQSYSDTANSAVKGYATSSNSTFNDGVCEENKICVRKCCQLREIMIEQQMENQPYYTCVPAEDESTRSYFGDYIAYGMFKAWSNLSTIDNVHIVVRMCEASYSPLNPYESRNYIYQLIENGSLILEGNARSQYCVEYIQNKSLVLPLVCWSDSELRQMTDKLSLPNGHNLYVGSLICSVILLILMIFVYAVLPTLRNLRGKNLLSYIACVIVRNSALCTVSFIQVQPDFACSFIALVIQFSFLASFFWMNVTCFNLWCTFRNHRPADRNSKKRDRKKFLAYSLYAWGCPTLIVITTIFLEYYPSLPDGFIKPLFGHKTCFFETTAAKIIYFYSFISVIVFCNSCMFINTMFILKGHTERSRVLERSNSAHFLDDNKQTFNLYLVKLFIAMGVPWIAELISFYYPPPIEPLWSLTDVGNALEGVLIFLMFVCNGRTRVLLKKTLFPDNSTRRNAETTSGRTARRTNPMNRVEIQMRTLHQ